VTAECQLLTHLTETGKSTMRPQILCCDTQPLLDIIPAPTVYVVHLKFNKHKTIKQTSSICLSTSASGVSSFNTPQPYITSIYIIKVEFAHLAFFFSFFFFTHFTVPSNIWILYKSSMFSFFFFSFFFFFFFFFPFFFLSFFLFFVCFFFLLFFLFFFFFILLFFSYFFFLFFFLFYFPNLKREQKGGGGYKHAIVSTFACS